MVPHSSSRSKIWRLYLGAFGNIAMVTTNVSAAPVDENVTWGQGSSAVSWGRKHRHKLGTSCSSCPTPSPQPGWWGSPGKCERTGGQVVPAQEKPLTVMRSLVREVPKGAESRVRLVVLESWAC